MAGVSLKHTSASLEEYSCLLSRYKELLPVLMQLNITEAHYFNIFEIMKIDSSEVKLHTPVLKALLDPKGEHAQGGLFYKEFIETLFEGPDKEKMSQYNIAHVSVEDEVVTRYGQIDLLIRNDTPDHSYVIIIENKIWGRDGDKQLERYLEFARSLLGFDESNIKLVYLRPFAANPATFSLDGKLRKRLSSKGVFKAISYEEEVLNWLQSCRDKIKAPVVKFTVDQYVHTLKKICR